MCILSQRTPAREAVTEAAKKHFCGARWKVLSQVKIPKVWSFLLRFRKPIAESPRKISQIVCSFPLKSMLTFLWVVVATLGYIHASIPPTWSVSSSCTYISVIWGGNRECPSRQRSQCRLLCWGWRQKGDRPKVIGNDYSGVCSILELKLEHTNSEQTRNTFVFWNPYRH